MLYNKTRNIMQNILLNTKYKNKNNNLIQHKIKKIC